MSARPLTKCIQCTSHRALGLPIRSFSTTARQGLETETQTPETQAPPPSTPKKPLDPTRVTTRHGEFKLLRDQRMVPIGSRRRRAAMKQSAGIPFAQLPYQCFQDARAYLQQDRAEKLATIQATRERIAKIEKTEVAAKDQGKKDTQLANLRKNLEETKLLADINDPLVKKTFEDGKGDLNKPIYRHLEDLKWRSYKRRILIQRLTQMNVVPDVIQTIDPVVNASLSFGDRKVPHGEIVEAHISEIAPTLNIQCYDKGKRLITIAVVNPDVPDVAKDGFAYRCHFLACNIEVSPTEPWVNLGKLLEDKQVVLPWLPAYSQKGLPYQRMSVLIFNQSKTGESATSPIDVAAIKAAGRDTARDGFIMRSFISRHGLTPVGADLFRTKWDESTAGVMQRAGIPGWDVEFKGKTIEPLPYKRKNGDRYR